MRPLRSCPAQLCLTCQQLGTMTFGPDESTGARVTSLDEYNRCLDYFQSQGYNEIDTARVYVGGKQEAFTREAHWKERGLAVATKWYPHQPGAHNADVLSENFNKSLQELGADCVDIFYLHAPGMLVSLPVIRRTNEVDAHAQTAPSLSPCP